MAGQHSIMHAPVLHTEDCVLDTIVVCYELWRVSVPEHGSLAFIHRLFRFYIQISRSEDPSCWERNQPI